MMSQKTMSRMNSKFNHNPFSGYFQAILYGTTGTTDECVREWSQETAWKLSTRLLYGSGHVTHACAG